MDVVHGSVLHQMAEIVQQRRHNECLRRLIRLRPRRGLEHVRGDRNLFA